MCYLFAVYNTILGNQLFIENIQLQKQLLQMPMSQGIK